MIDVTIYWASLRDVISEAAHLLCDLHEWFMGEGTEVE